ncbi:MAG: hypothetical protein ACJ71P_20710 [Nitrososphaeraceae archaeon]
MSGEASNTRNVNMRRRKDNKIEGAIVMLLPQCPLLIHKAILEDTAGKRNKTTRQRDETPATAERKNQDAIALLNVAFSRFYFNPNLSLAIISNGGH